MSSMKFYSFVSGPYHGIRMQFDPGSMKEVRMQGPRTLSMLAQAVPMSAQLDPPPPGSCLYRLEKRGAEDVFVFVSQEK